MTASPATTAESTPSSSPSSEHDRRYYVDNKPSISDHEYDLLAQGSGAPRSHKPELGRGAPADAVVGHAPLPPLPAPGADVVARQHLQREDELREFL